MLNLSKNSIEGKIDTSSFKSFSMVTEYKGSRSFTRLLLISFAITLVAMFLPWTQNIRSRGYVTTLLPSQRPQTIHSVIAGRIEQWFVKEGSYVAKGDTILHITEIKDAYFDPQLLSRTESQIKAKELSVGSYSEKVKSLNKQIVAVQQMSNLKLEQAQNYIMQAKLKIQSDSMDLEAAKANFQIAENQLARMELLYAEGLKSLTDVEARRLKVQETRATNISAENKLLASRNQLINAQVELKSVENQYQDKLSKAESDKYAALSDQYNAEANVTKMQNEYVNYSTRKGFHYITAQQDGYVTKAIRSGIGETVKEGEELVSIMPAKYDLAIAMYIEPMDLPLIASGQKVRFMFDGWPSVVFSGWPNLSYGTFGGEVVAIDNFISNNGLYRIIVAPDKQEVAWPEGLRVGSGADGMAILNNVPVWYELWRQLNGFPPDYYKASDSQNKLTEAKK